GALGTVGALGAAGAAGDGGPAGEAEPPRNSRRDNGGHGDRRSAGGNGAGGNGRADTDRHYSAAGWDLAIIHVVHPGSDLAWVWDCPRVLDATYQFDGAPRRSVV
ncbi:MAG TPA: hypothetical protein VHV49_00115, partial [Pseudonocardiaceae bacterium]|nr:hypothetical protein [Pseudonocardiaceae bacterium]